jgi:hypothetical protein
MKKKIYSIFVYAVILLSVFIFCSFAITEQFNEKINTKIALNSDCPEGYTYIEVIENGQVWIYVYCGETFVYKYIEVVR